MAVHISVSFSKAGKNTALLDLDPQASSSEWGDVRNTDLPHVQSIHAARLKKTIEQLKDIGADIVVLDTAPHSESTALDAARISNLILVPCRPSIVDLRAMSKTVDLLKLVKVPAFAVMNGVPHHSLQAADEAARTIDTVLGLPVCPVRIGERVAYNRCLIDGKAAQEYDPGGKAAQEVEQLRQWVESVI